MAEERRSHFIIAIDGPAASGKSSTATWVAETLGVRHADSGAVYRAVTLARLGRSDASGAWTEDSVLQAAAHVLMRMARTSFLVTVDGAPVETLLHGAEVTARVSTVARMPLVRAWVNSRMRSCAAMGAIVVDGRDMGTVVFPDAVLKIFLVADPWERARRRLIQRLGRAPREDEIAAETEDLVRRDAHDAPQTSAAADAVLMDTTFLTQEEQVSRIVALARAALAGGSTAIDRSPSD